MATDFGRGGAPWWMWVLILLGLSMAYNERFGEKVEDREPVARPSIFERDESSMAFIMMQDFVKKRLKSPSTAKMPWQYKGDGTSVAKEGNIYTVVSWVDSQNSFGAMIRTVYAGRIEQVNDDQWRLVELSFVR